MTNSIHKRLGRFHGFLLHFDLGLLTIVLLPFVLIAEKFIAPEKRASLWRRTAVWIIRTVLQLNNVELKIKHQGNIPSQPAIYAANHPSEMDGFMLLSILGHNTIIFTAPLDQFPAILKTWLKKMQAVDVRRDPIDDRRYPKGYSKQEAIDLATYYLRQGKNLIIFPEGHIEIMHVLHYFHTGAARISLKSHTPIVPVSLINADKIFPDGKHLYPDTVLITFGKVIATNKTAASKSTILNLRKQFEHAISYQLPSRYLPYLYNQRSKNVGVFVDIDRTIYESLSQKDLIAYLVWLHKIKAKEAFKVFYWLFLEKMHQIQHKDLMKKSLLILKGWDVAELQHEISQTFDKKLTAKIQYGLYPILKDHSEQNHSIVLVSEAIHPLAREFKKLLHARGSLDTRLESMHHCYTGETNCLCYKEQKARLVEQFAKRASINLKKSFAYADSSADIPFLSLIKYPTAVNPDDALLDYAVDHDWAVMLDAS